MGQEDVGILLEELGSATSAELTEILRYNQNTIQRNLRMMHKHGEVDREVIQEGCKRTYRYIAKGYYAYGKEITNIEKVSIDDSAKV